MDVRSRQRSGRMPGISEMAALQVIITCIILSINNQGAHAQEEPIVFTIFEESPRFTFVGDIPERANLKTKLNASVIQNLRFSIIPGRDEFSDYFTIEEESGILRTDRKIDRDTICPTQESCSIDLTISAHSPPDHLTVIKASVLITDNNDNAPEFPQGQITKSIPENTRVGTSLSISLAEDKDSPKYGVKEYRVLSGSAEFLLKVVNDTDGVSDLYLVLQEAVDREARDSYKIVIAAVDGGQPPNTGTLTIDILITDINDHPPVFTETTYTTIAREDATEGTVILRVAATDLDTGTNGEVLYRFSSQTDTDHGDLFRLDDSTGDLSVKGKLDYEQTKQYTLQVLAQDKDGDWLPSEAKVIVNIQDVNDNPPQISVSGLSSSRLVEISEASPRGSYVAYISAEDPDSGDNGQFDCTMNSDTFAIEPLTQGEFKLLTKVELDREQVAEYRLPFSCVDKGQPPMTSTSSVQVTILDENDNSPAFSESSYTHVMEENNMIGAVLTSLTASDPDSGDNGRVTLAVVEGGHFARLLNNGTLVATAAYNYEEMQEFVVKVQATDAGETPRTTITDVRVILEDVNDQAPAFVVSKYTFGVMENLDEGAHVGDVVAKDSDSAPFNDLSYSLKDAEEMFKLFMIDGITGKITTRTKFDRETIPGYSLVVLATDVNNPRLSSSATVSIYIMDANDNAPIFTFPNGTHHILNISNATPMGETLTYVRASDDMDTGENARVTYAMEGGDDVFTVDEYSGAIHVNKDLIGYKAKVFHLKVVAEDAGTPPKSAETSLYINVNEDIVYTGELATEEGKHNITIVITVAVVTIVLVFVLVLAIVFILRRTNKDKMKKNHLKTLLAIQQSDGHYPDGDALYMEKTRDASVTSSKSGKKDVSFSNDVDLQDETPSSSGYNEDLYKQVHKGSNEGAKNGKYAAAPGPKKPMRQPPPVPVHQQGQYYVEESYPSPPYPGHTQPWENNQQQPYMQKEDNVSVNSQDSTNTDSGRGSNEDAESRPSSMETDSRQYNNQGDGRYRRDSAAQGSARFKKQLSSVLEMQTNHINDNINAQSVGVYPRGAHPRGSDRDMHRPHTPSNSATSPANNAGLHHHSPFTNSYSSPAVNPHTPGTGERREQGETVASLSASYV